GETCACGQQGGGRSGRVLACCEQASPPSGFPFHGRKALWLNHGSSDGSARLFGRRRGRVRLFLDPLSLRSGRPRPAGPNASQIPAMDDRYLKTGVFLAPFHGLAENPLLALERDMELLVHLDRANYHEAWIGEHHSGGFEIVDCTESVIAAAAQRTP